MNQSRHDTLRYITLIVLPLHIPIPLFKTTNHLSQMLKLLDNETNVGWMVRVTICRKDNPEQSYSTSEIGHAFARNKFQVFHTALASVASVPYIQPKPTDKAARGCPIESVIITPKPQRQFFIKRKINKPSVFTLTRLLAAEPGWPKIEIQI